MRIHRPYPLIAVLGLSLATPLWAQYDHESPLPEGDIDRLGAVSFQPQCGDAAARTFDRGLALKHHMMYQEARGLFRAMSDEHPDCAMGHWGLSATYFQPLWPERPDAEALQAGREAIERAQDIGPQDPREEALIQAVAAFFDDADDPGYRDRIDRWSEGMATAHEAHPDDPDIGALYGLSRLALAMAAEGDQRDALHDEAEKVLRAVWTREPTHPGAIHYSIHATDVDGRAENALDMVQAYAEIAPSVPHALHMPSHIYVRLGEWDEVIEWNRRSANAAKNHDVNGATSFHYIHALDYLVYGHLQKGDIDKAQDVWQEARSTDRHQSGFASAYHAAAMPARLAVEARDWSTARDLSVKTPDYLPWENTFWPLGLSWYARGLGAIHTQDRELAEQAERRLAELRDAAHADGEDRFATYIEVDRKILEGWIRQDHGETEEAIALMESAAELESTVEKDPVTPGALYPPYEALGDLLMTLERPQEALDAYQAGDNIWPERRNTLVGIQRARTQTEISSIGE